MYCLHTAVKVFSVWNQRDDVTINSTNKLKDPRLQLFWEIEADWLEWPVSPRNLSKTIRILFLGSETLKIFLTAEGPETPIEASDITFKVFLNKVLIFKFFTILQIVKSIIGIYKLTLQSGSHMPLYIIQAAVWIQGGSRGRPPPPFGQRCRIFNIGPKPAPPPRSCPPSPSKILHPHLTRHWTMYYPILYINVLGTALLHYSHQIKCV